MVYIRHIKGQRVSAVSGRSAPLNSLRCVARQLYFGQATVWQPLYLGRDEVLSVIVLLKLTVSRRIRLKDTPMRPALSVTGPGEQVRESEIRGAKATRCGVARGRCRAWRLCGKRTGLLL
eukprot:scaffold78940_cov33-Tisochrysis_lutea.AAC.2